MPKQLCITLGHNSSCILLEEGKIICGYENERLSRIKADSQFPRLAIEQCLRYSEPYEINKIFISHWSTDGKLNSLAYKHYNPYYLPKIRPNASIYSLSKDFTHHDAHFWAAKCFAKDFKKDNIFTLVADGFGNFGETISLYYEDNLVKRVFGYDTSLGLLYQYATAYLGLKMNQDEYKLLGYEVHIHEILSMPNLMVLKDEINKWIKRFTRKIHSLVPSTKFDPICSLDSLPALRLAYSKQFDFILSKLKIEKNSYDKKVIISYFVQRIVEGVILKIISSYRIKNICLSGGLFLNVKLNNEISKRVKEICVTPLCGDQGAALGLYYKHYPNLEINDICWGHRSINKKELNPEIWIFPNNPEVINKEIISFLRLDYIVNIIQGPMEFGPRALCNTSTLAKPTKENVEYINKVNSRDTIMPMGPVVVDPYLYFMSEDVSKIHKSLKYMIMAIDYRNIVNRYIEGVTHYGANITGRPQVISEDHTLYEIVKEFGILINTSFNTHGMPIVYNSKDINEAHIKQRELDVNNKMLTIFIDN